MDQGVTKEQFLRSFKNVVAICLKISKKLDADSAAMKADFADLSKKLKDDTTSDLEEIKTQARIAIGATIEAHSNRLAKVENTVAGLKNTDEEALLARMQALIPAVVAETGATTRDRLETLQGDERLDIRAVKGLEEALAQAQKDGKPIRIGTGRLGMYIFVGGKKIGTINMLDFVPSGSMGISYSVINGRPSMTFTASGGGTNVETPTGTVDGTNTQFTPTKEPKYVISDGTTYFENNGYTWDGTHINMTIPPSQFIRDIY